MNEEEEENEDLEMDLFEGEFESQVNEELQAYEKKELENHQIKGNSFYEKIEKETKNLLLYLNESKHNFHKLFNIKDLTTFEDALKYLENTSNKNTCVCAKVINNYAAWRCEDCSQYDSAIYCNDCYKKSKHLHKNHKMLFLYSSGGMCDCGDPDSFSIFCPEHSGPYSDQNEINKYISSIFSKEIINNLKEFFNEFFSKFYKYFILIEKCELFCNKKYEEYFCNDINIKDEIINKERRDIDYLKMNFCALFQDLLDFLRQISLKNFGMLNILANFLLKNQFKENKTENEEEYKTLHSCIKIEENNIEIKQNDKMQIENNNNNRNDQHICECPFLRLLFINWTEHFNIKKEENDKFLLSFPKIFPLKRAFCIIYFFDYHKFVLNNNFSILKNKTQFYAEEITVPIATKTTLIENSFDNFYNYFSKEIKSIKSLSNSFNPSEIFFNSLYIQASYKEEEIEYFSKPKIKELIGTKISIIKRIIDCICLIHNEYEFKSIYPHPEFQNKGFSENFLYLEKKLLSIIEKLTIFMMWENIDLSKEIFNYIINKIMNQEKEGIKQLKEDEYSFHLSLYRCFGLMTNYFCFFYALNNRCNIIDSIEFFKKNFFKSQKDINLFAEKILNDYFKLLGFIGGTKNDFFNYYNNIEYYYIEYLYIKNISKIDFTLMKYLFVMKENNFSLSSYLKLSNIENVYSSFEEHFKQNNKENNKMIIEENIIKLENNIIEQWKFILDLIIIFMKDSANPYWSYIREYENIISLKTKNDLFDNIRKNKNIMDDLESILRLEIIHGIVSKGNLIDIENIKEEISSYLIALFGEKKFKEILDELTYNKMNKEKKLFYLKDCNLKYLDMNYYICPKSKSKAQNYILEFKKNIIKPYNSYYFNPSELTFNFFKNVYEKILLNKENLELMIIIVEKILMESGENEEDIKSIKNNFLPSVLNYLSVFGCINTESFIKFKVENKILIDRLIHILTNSLENNKDNKLLDNDLEEYIKEIICQIKRYEVINNYISSNKIKFKEYDYNINNIENYFDNKSNKNIIIENKDIKENSIMKTRNLKELLKNKMKSKTQKFMDKAKLNENILKSINEQNKKEQNINNSNKESMCFFCRNTIKLDSFETPYGKAGFLAKDFFYINSIKSTVKSEIIQLSGNKFDNDLYEKMIESDVIKLENERIISCGHYFHLSCFQEHNKNIFNPYLNCPLCLKKMDIIIPPLSYFQKNFSFLKPVKMALFNKKERLKKFDIDKESQIFLEIINNFLKGIINPIKIKMKIDKKIESPETFIGDLFFNYKYYFHFLENIFYINGTHFNKLQQIDIIQNFILSIRYLVKNNILNINLVLNIIKDILSSLIKGPRVKESILFNYENMHYKDSLEKLLFLLSVLFNFNELKSIFPYIINLFLPYFSFGFYLRDLIAKNKFYTLSLKRKQNLKDKNIEDYLSTNNNYMVNNCFHYFIQKLVLVKLITDYDNINEDTINKFNDLSLEKMLSLLDLEKLYNLIKKKSNNEIKFLDIFKYLPKLFKLDDVFYIKYGSNYNYQLIFESLINNLKSKKSEKYIVKKELIIQFIPIKFNFINLDKNIFDLIENNLDKKCIMCYKYTKHHFICLICGKKMCHSRTCNDYIEHLKDCTGDYCIYINMEDMQSFLCSDEKNKILYPLYVNEAGVGPSEHEIGNEYNLSEENLQMALKNFICNDYNFN